MRLIIIFLSLTIYSCSTGIAYLPIKSMHYYKWEHIVKQDYDYSCGASAIATILNGYFEDNKTEKEILEDMVINTKPEDLENKYIHGFSMLDLIKSVERKGYIAVGVRLSEEDLSKLAGPVIFVIRTKTFFHFIVFRATKGDRIFIADPTFGNTRMAIKNFLEIWDGYSIIIGKYGVDIKTVYPLGVTNRHTNPEANEARKVLLP